MSIVKLRIHAEAIRIAADIASTAREWVPFDQKTIGSQLVRAADSVCANIAEGYGRVSPGERYQFFFYAEASCQEVKSHVQLAELRSLFSAEQSIHLQNRLTSLSISIMAFCRKDLARYPMYNGPYRALIERRTAFLDP